MANRSDFFNTNAKTPKLPRYLKKALALQSDGNAHEDGSARRAFIDAHMSHVKFKLKRGEETVTNEGIEE